MFFVGRVASRGQAEALHDAGLGTSSASYRVELGDIRLDLLRWESGASQRLHLRSQVVGGGVRVVLSVDKRLATIDWPELHERPFESVANRFERELDDFVLIDISANGAVRGCTDLLGHARLRFETHDGQLYFGNESWSLLMNSSKGRHDDPGPFRHYEHNGICTTFDPGTGALTRELRPAWERLGGVRGPVGNVAQKPRELIQNRLSRAELSENVAVLVSGGLDLSLIHI